MELKANGAKGDCEYTRLPLSELERFTSNAFAFSNENFFKHIKHRTVFILS